MQNALKPHVVKTGAFLCASIFACMPTADLNAAEQFVVKNGGMTQGDDLPDEWTGRFGEVAATRDTEIFKQAPASLRITAIGGKSGNAFQKFTGGSGKKLRLAGWLKSQGNVKVQAAVHAFADGFKQNRFIQLHYIQGDTDWVQFEKEVQLPEWTSFFNVLLMVEGDGNAWLDEVHEASGPVDAGQPKSLQERMTSSPAPKGKPWEPGWGFYPQFPTIWRSHFQSQLDRTKQGDAKVVFIGDSITQGWSDAGRGAWTEHFEHLGSVNYGIGGDSTRQVLWRIQHGLLDGIHPQLIVLKIGTNNLYQDNNGGTDEEIARGIETVVEQIREKAPQTPVLLLGILPRQNEYFSRRIQHINSLISKLAQKQGRVRFLDIGERFQATPGKGDVREELFSPDKLHLGAKGYDVFAKAIQPAVAELLKPSN